MIQILSYSFRSMLMISISTMQIRVYGDKVSIFNSGSLPDGWTLDNLLSQHESNPRNPLIASAFYRAGLIEAWGRGIERIMTSCHDEGKPEPIFIVSSTGVRVTLLDADKDITDSNVGDNVGVGDKLNPTQVKILELISLDTTISTQSMADAIGVTKRSVERNIRALRMMGSLERIGSDKKGQWVVK